MIRELIRNWWRKRAGSWWEDYNTHTTGGQRNVVAICPKCRSPRMNRGGWENPFYRCRECSPLVRQKPWMVETMDVETYKEEYL